MAQANRNNRRDEKPAQKPGQSLVVIEQSLVKTEPRFTQLANAARRGMDYHREFNFALSIIKESEQLQKCHADSFVEAFENLGAMGLSLNRNLGHAALIPRWNKKRKTNWAVAMPMYRGLISLATGGSVIKNVWGAAVVDGDYIDVVGGSKPQITHKPKIAKRGENRRPSFDNMLGAYCVADIAGSEYPHCTWLSIDDIVAIAQRSDSFNPKPRDKYEHGQPTGEKYTPEPSGPWVTDPGEMAVKSAFRRGFKTWPGIDRVEYTALQEAVRVDTEAETIDHDQDEAGVTIEGQAQEVVQGTLSAEEVKELDGMARERKLNPERVAAAYGKKSLSEVPSELYLEVKKRIEKVTKNAA